MHAPAKPAYPVITPAELEGFDAFIFGIPTRYGNFPAQWKVRIAYSYPLVATCASCTRAYACALTC